MNDQEKNPAKAADISAEQLAFAVFCIESLAEHFSLTGSEMYDLLTQQSRVLETYILPFYDALHTQSKAYIVEDIADYMRTLGVVQ